ncbi:carboxylesterase/lipase family protein [Actinokineospora bangkokensis]|uniref:Carboxylic ester hydrolase n=1 Tax=Actinokineospora bangkokensis TaxID=1193682 RepID=A0A1Q9LNZ7_9PSEU|nr:carboxylesterase family protein [Actinokineospora bangkokensis]OLR93738.1 carboxylesterase [Actinokineospora bangkokensis]
MDRVVRTSAGLVRGTGSGGVTRFLGIPYAAAPVGPLRFAGPSPVEPWAGTRDAVAFSAAPVQGPPAPGVPSPWQPDDGFDSLSVNVWTPDDGGSGLPVMVWVYGGAYKTGSSSLPSYEASRLAAHGVVVVTLNYRLGFEGFGVLPGAPANRGHLDQLAALEWVHSEIAAFGGDPGLITVFGESAGAAAVGVLLTTPRTEGLIRRGIAQSIPSGYRTLESAEAITAALAAELGVRPTVEGFAAVAPEAILPVLDSPLRGQQLGITAFGPVVDGEVVLGDPWAVIGDGRAAHVDLVSGFCHEEFRLFSMLTDMTGVTVDGVARAQRLSPEQVQRYRDTYPGAAEQTLVEVIMSDALFRMPSTWLAEAHARAGGRAWLYDFAWAGPLLGACHSVDIPFTFGVTDTPISALLLGTPPPPEFEALSEAFRKSWASFAATGDPGWPQFTPDERTTRVWDNQIVDGPYPIPESAEIWAGRA